MIWPFNRGKPLDAKNGGDPSGILDTRLMVKLDMGAPFPQNMEFLVDARKRAHLAGQLLLYDRIVVPTYDFGIIPTLFAWLGHKKLQEALEGETFSFLRHKGLLVYAGNGNALSTIVVREAPGRPFEWVQKAVFGEVEEAVEAQVRHLCRGLDRKQRSRFIQLVMRCSKPVLYENDAFIRDVAQESYVDIRESPELARQALSLAREKKGDFIDLQRLPGVAENQVRVLSDQLRDSVDLVLRVAEVNLQLLMGRLAGGVDLYVSGGAERILGRKLSRMGVPNALVEGFVRLLDLNNVPDVEAAVASEVLDIHDVWKLRQKRSARRFRKWLRHADVREARDLERLYVEALGRSSLAQRLPTKALRFGLTSAAGLAGPIAGAATGAVDTFFGDQLLSGYCPKLFFDDLKRLTGR